MHDGAAGGSLRPGFNGQRVHIRLGEVDLITHRATDQTCDSSACDVKNACDRKREPAFMNVKYEGYNNSLECCCSILPFCTLLLQASADKQL